MATIVLNLFVIQAEWSGGGAEEAPAAEAWLAIEFVHLCDFSAGSKTEVGSSVLLKIIGQGVFFLSLH